MKTNKTAPARPSHEQSAGPLKAPVEEKIDRLAYALARPGGNFEVAPPANYIFWLGAGFSKSAGIPLAEGIVDRLLDKRWRPSSEIGSKPDTFGRLSADDQAKRRLILRKWADDNKLLGTEPIADWGASYGKCLHLLPGEVDRQEFIIECIEEGRGRLNMAHLLLGQLIKNHHVNTVLTTNFDDLLLRALQLYFVVPSTLDPESTSTLLTNSRFVQAAYLHGKLASYRQRHTPDEVSDSIPGFENYLTQALQDHGLVVIGYRGGNETPLHILHKVLTERRTGPGRGLFWVTNTTSVEDLPAKVREVLALKDCYWLPGWDADDFMKELCAWPGIGLGIPNPIEWRKGMEEMLPAEARELMNQTQATEPTKLRLPPTKPEENIDEDSESPPWILGARKFIEEGAPEKAIEVLEAVRPASVESLDGLMLFSRAYRNLGNNKEAVSLAQEAVSKFPGENGSFFNLGEALREAEQHDDAVAAFKRAIELGGGREAKLWYGVMLNRANRPAESVDVLADLAADSTETEFRQEALAWWGTGLFDLGKHDEAIDKFKQSASLNPNDPFTYFFWSHALRALGRLDEADEKLAEYNRLQPKPSPQEAKA